MRYRNPSLGIEEPSQEVLRKIKLSWLEAQRVQTRDLKCPICGFLLRQIPVDAKDMLYVVCRKCKFKGPLSPGLFRRQKCYEKSVPYSSVKH